MINHQRFNSHLENPNKNSVSLNASPRIRDIIIKVVSKNRYYTFGKIEEVLNQAKEEGLLTIITKSSAHLDFHTFQSDLIDEIEGWVEAGGRWLPTSYLAKKMITGHDIVNNTDRWWIDLDQCEEFEVDASSDGLFVQMAIASINKEFDEKRITDLLISGDLIADFQAKSIYDHSKQEVGRIVSCSNMKLLKPSFTTISPQNIPF